MLLSTEGNNAQCISAQTTAVVLTTAGTFHRFKPVKLRLKIDFVSYLARAEGLGKYDKYDKLLQSCYKSAANSHVQKYRKIFDSPNHTPSNQCPVGGTQNTWSKNIEKLVEIDWNTWNHITDINPYFPSGRIWHKLIQYMWGPRTNRDSCVAGKKNAWSPQRSPYCSASGAKQST